MFVWMHIYMYLSAELLKIRDIEVISRDIDLSGYESHTCVLCFFLSATGNSDTAPG